MGGGTAQPLKGVVFVTNLPPLCSLSEGTLGPVDTNMNSVHKEMNLYHIQDETVPICAQCAHKDEFCRG